MPLLSLIINCDNRIGYLAEKSTVGDFGTGSLQGVRSKDLLTFGIQNKINYFKGYDLQCVVYLDVHEPLTDELLSEITTIVESCGNNSRVVLVPHSKDKYRWNDHLYIDALKYAEGEFTCHMDMDCACFKKEDFDILKYQIEFLDSGYKYVCQSWDGIGDTMWHASTRYFICKTELLKEHLSIAENNLVTPFMGKWTPCLEHLLAAIAGENSVLYPNREDDKYIIFCWASYFSGLMQHLMEQPYEKTIKYLQDCGIFGTHDILAKPITNE